MLGQEVGGFFAMRYEECTARVHLDSQITLALFGLFFHCTALERRRYTLTTLQLSELLRN